MSTILTMEILRVATVLTLFCFYSIFCFPSRPLNERSTELAWQAWLLVDDQNQNKQYDPDSLTRRRITPKSVFIAPTFSPESLPACAEGYRPDSMGRCIKIIKLDEEAHLDFLLQKLQEQFGNYDELDDEQEDTPTAGPFQLNIPLSGGIPTEKTKDEEHGGVDIAIVVAPTNGNFALEETVKTTVKRTNVQTHEKLPESGSLPQPFNLNSFKRKTEQNEETTTLENLEETTTIISAETSTTTTTERFTTESTIPTTVSTQPQPQETTTQEIEPQETTTISDQHALFFLKPTFNNTNHVQNGTNNAEGTPVVESGDYSVVISNDSLTTLLSNSTLVNTSVNLNNKPATDFNRGQVQFKDPVDSGDLMASEDFHQSAGLVRFPTTEEEQEQPPRIDYIKYPEKVTQNHLLPHVNTNTYASQFQHVIPPQKLQPPQPFGTLFDEYLHSRGADLKGNERFVFKNPQGAFTDNLGSDPKNGEHKMHANHDRFQSNGGYERVFNHRNRDKHWSLPPSWSESSPQKPIVLRFSRRSSNGRHLLEEHLRPQTQNSPTFYREVPSEDFSYIFGFDSNHDRRRNRR